MSIAAIALRPCRNFDSGPLHYQRFEAARQDSILHPEGIVGNSETIQKRGSRKLAGLVTGKVGFSPANCRSLLARFSGHPKNSRPELNKLMDDARKRWFDAIVVWRFDRFARSTKHLLAA